MISSRVNAWIKCIVALLTPLPFLSKPPPSPPGTARQPSALLLAAAACVCGSRRSQSVCLWHLHPRLSHPMEMSTAESAPAGADSSSSSAPAPDAPSQPQHESHSSQGNQPPPLSRKDKRKRQQQQQAKEQRQPKQQQQQQQQRAPRPEFPPIEVEYVVKDGLRHVVPYVYAFAARAKGRWWGRPVLEVCVWLQSAPTHRRLIHRSIHG